MPFLTQLSNTCTSACSLASTVPTLDGRAICIPNFCPWLTKRLIKSLKIVLTKKVNEINLLHHSFVNCVSSILIDKKDNPFVQRCRNQELCSLIASPSATIIGLKRVISRIDDAWSWKHTSRHLNKNRSTSFPNIKY